MRVELGYLFNDFLAHSVLEIMLSGKFHKSNAAEYRNFSNADRFSEYGKYFCTSWLMIILFANKIRDFQNLPSAMKSLYPPV